MVGDAPGDWKAAKANGVLFYPIDPGAEDESWQRFFEEALPRFFAGTFAGDYMDAQIDRFEALLPERPTWRYHLSRLGHAPTLSRWRDGRGSHDARVVVSPDVGLVQSDADGPLNHRGFLMRITSMATSRKTADIGLIGLAVMGENLVLNMESHGFTVAVFNRTTSKVDAFVDGASQGEEDRRHPLGRGAGRGAQAPAEDHDHGQGRAARSTT